MNLFLHLGADISVFGGDVIGIFDYDLSNLTSFREFLELAQWNDKVYRIDGEPKSIVLTESKIYLVPVARSTLARRWENYTRPLRQELKNTTN